MLWVVIGEYCGCKSYWGLYEDESVADEVARRVNGTKRLWSEIQKN